MPISPPVPRAASFVLLSVLTLTPAFGFTLSGTTYTTDGSVADISAALNAANSGETVQIPAGSFTWTSGPIYVAKAVTLAGAGVGKTVITLGAGAPVGTSGAIELFAAATVSGMTINQTGSATPFSVTDAANNWRITAVTYNAVSVSGYFCYIAGGYGLIDNCTINSGGGSNELVETRGPTNSWQTPDSLGTANAVYVEDCTFNGPGYVCDANANARMVVRFNTITGPMKVDAHGYASNTPRGCRQIEVYGNTWTTNVPVNPGIEIRGGTGMVFGNQAINDLGSTLWFFLDDYGSLSVWPNFGNVYETPVNSPITDQIGVGEDPKVAGSDPLYVWNNQSAAGTNAGAATVRWPLTWKAIPAAAIAQYSTQIGNPSATFVMGPVGTAAAPAVLQQDRDFYWDGSATGAFNGSSGVGVGTLAQMQAIKATKKGVGYWVTNQGSWNTKLAANTSGAFYVWNGAAWSAKYTPLTYPHPLRSAAPKAVVSSSTVPAGQLTVMSVPPLSGASYQWQLNGVNVPGATNYTLVLTNLAAYQSGTYTLEETINGVMHTSNAVFLSVTQNARLLDLSANDYIGTSQDIITVGATVGGTGSKQLLFRGDGPGLSILGVTGALASTSLSVDDSASTLVATDAGWGNPLVLGASTLTSATSATPAEFIAVGAFAFGAGSADSALLVSAPQGAISARLSGLGTATGIGQGEIFDADAATASAYLTKLSAQGGVNYNGKVLVAGFVIAGPSWQTVLIYGLGPTLQYQGVSHPLADPRLTLFGTPPSGLSNMISGSAPAVPVQLVQNVGWFNAPAVAGTSLSPGIIPATTALMTTASAAPLTNNRNDSAFIATLPPGTYTVQIDSVSGGAGIARVEIYNLP